MLTKMIEIVDMLKNRLPDICTRAQSTVDFPIGGHVNVLSDYKETGPEKKSKF